MSEIRYATKQELPLVAEIIERCREIKPNENIYRVFAARIEYLNSLYACKKLFPVLCFTDDGIPVGCILGMDLADDGRENIRILNQRVLPEHRKNGYGTKLHRFIIEEMKAKGYEKAVSEILDSDAEIMEELYGWKKIEEIERNKHGFFTYAIELNVTEQKEEENDTNKF